MRTLKFAVSPAEPVWTFNNKIRSIRYDEGAGVNTRIIVTETSGNLLNLEMKPGDLIRLDEGEFANGVQVIASDGGTISGKISLGAGLLSSNNIVGDVNVIDNSGAFVIGGIAYICGVSISAVAGQYSYCMIWNGEAVNIEVESLKILNGAASAMTFVGGFTTSSLPSTVSLRSKFSGLGDSLAYLAISSSAADLIPPTENGLIYSTISAGQSEINQFRKPLVIEPGKGLIIRPVAVNISMGLSTEVVKK